MLEFRTATAEDLPAIVRLLADDPLGRTREVIGPTLDPRYLAAYDAIVADLNQRLLVACADGEVVGCLQLSFIPGLTHAGRWRGQIEGVRVSGDRRGAGIGEAMLGFAIEECRRRGCGLVQLTTDKARTDAHRFYERLGFVASHEGMKLGL